MAITWGPNKREIEAKRREIGSGIPLEIKGSEPNWLIHRPVPNFPFKFIRFRSVVTFPLCFFSATTIFIKRILFFRSFPLPCASGPGKARNTLYLRTGGRKIFIPDSADIIHSFLRFGNDLMPLYRMHKLNSSNNTWTIRDKFSIQMQYW